MLSIPISSLLADLHPSTSTEAASGIVVHRDVAPSSNASDLAIDRAFDTGRAAGLREVETELARQRSVLEAMYSRREVEAIAILRAELSSQVNQALQQMTSSACADIERILKPFLARRASDEAIEAIMREARGILETAKGKVYGHVKGTRRMIDVFRPMVEANGHEFKFECSESLDIQIRIGESWLETRIGEWLGTIEAAL